MDKTECPICKEQISKQDFKEVYVSPYNKQEYKRYECPNCDVHWWEPLKIVPEFYENEMFVEYIDIHKGTRELPDWCKPFFRYFPSEIRGSLLDIGCGDGIFLKYAKEAGFEVWGIDFDRKSVEVAKRKLGLDTIFATNLEEFYKYAKSKNLRFDVITFFEVLEHQDRPKEFLQIVKELLKEGGYIAGSVPNRQRLFAQLEWKYYNPDYPPHHFLRFSKVSLEKALKLNGFSSIEVYKLDFPFKELIPFIDKKFFGSLESLKIKLKAFVIGDKIKAKEYVVEELDVASRNKVILKKMLISLKKLRNLSLLPFAILYIPKLKGNGVSLYFQAKL